MRERALEDNRREEWRTERERKKGSHTQRKWQWRVVLPGIADASPQHEAVAVGVV